MINGVWPPPIPITKSFKCAWKSVWPVLVFQLSFTPGQSFREDHMGIMILNKSSFLQVWKIYQKTIFHLKKFAYSIVDHSTCEWISFHRELPTRQSMMKVSKVKLKADIISSKWMPKWQWSSKTVSTFNIHLFNFPCSTCCSTDLVVLVLYS